MKENSQNDNSKEYFMRVIYKDASDCIRSVTISLKDAYCDDMSYRDNIEEMVSYIYNDGGLWIASDQIIPYHRILSFDAVNAVDKIQEQKSYSKPSSASNPTSNPTSRPKIKRKMRRSTNGMITHSMATAVTEENGNIQKNDPLSSQP